MWNSKKSVNFSITVCFILAFVLLALIFFGPTIFELYMTKFRGFLPDGEALSMLKKVFLYTFYPCSVFSAIILYSLIGLLLSIKKEEVFISSNVKRLKTVSWCCFVICFITSVSGVFYMPFMFVSLAGGFVGVMLRVLKNVMQGAVELREENDLTI